MQHRAIFKPFQTANSWAVRKSKLNWIQLLTKTSQQFCPSLANRKSELFLLFFYWKFVEIWNLSDYEIWTLPGFSSFFLYILYYFKDADICFLRSAHNGPRVWVVHCLYKTQQHNLWGCTSSIGLHIIELLILLDRYIIFLNFLFIYS